MAERARMGCRKKYDKERNELFEQCQFLKEEDGSLNIKIKELTLEIGMLEGSLNSPNQTVSRRPSKTNL